MRNPLLRDGEIGEINEDAFADGAFACYGIEGCEHDVVSTGVFGEDGVYLGLGLHGWWE